MPYINGRYYMNPQYGAAVERAREADEADASEAQFEDSSAPQIEYMSAASQEQPNRTPSPQPRPSASGKAHASQHTPPRAQEHKAEVGYGETSGLLPQKSAHAPAHAGPYDRRTWDKNSTHDLQQARQNIMDISDRNHRVHRAKPGKDTISQATWDDNMRAAENSTGSLPGNHFFIRQAGIGPQRPPERDKWGQGKPIRSYGPFRNVGGGDVPKGNSTYIDIYNH